jgi:hypothetical protein
MVPGLADDMC